MYFYIHFEGDVMELNITELGLFVFGMLLGASIMGLIMINIC